MSSIKLKDKYGDILMAFAEVTVATLIGLGISAILIKVGGYSPTSALYYLFKGAFGNLYGFYTTLSYSIPLMLTGLAFAVSVRAGLFNIGAEGQVYISALGAIMVASIALPSYLYLPAEFAVGVTFAIAWSLTAGILKVWKGVNEVVSTIMLNWIAYWVVEYSRSNIYYDPLSPDRTIRIPVSGRLPLLIPNTQLYSGIFISLAVVVIFYIIIWKTAIGYEIRAVGLNPNASKYGGIRISLVALEAFAISGLLAGLAGVMETIGRPPTYAIVTSLTNLVNLGFNGITVSLIGRNNPLGIIPASIFIGGLTAGATSMQIFAGVPLEMVQAVQGVIVIVLAIPGVIRLIKSKIRR
ncbi:MAG TPA: ABC transporter permease [Fervidicoccus fontis]|uniref:ABC transporter permease n=1 Tax=Fervidicoccus fontis TaxID=683846 RepID=A0A7C2YTN3_9CREN|nr:ABC transporter permease [Fervidicoccus fontis]